MGLSREDIDSAIREFEEFMGGVWTIPREAAVAFIEDHYDEANLLTISDVNARYLGSYEEPANFAQAMAVQAFPPPDRPDLGAGVDWKSWPFCFIDWERAGQELVNGPNATGWVRYDRQHYFSTVAD